MSKNLLKMDSIKQIIANREVWPMGRIKAYTVLVPLLKIDKNIHVLFQVRSVNLNNQPGEISFPGGGVENNEGFEDACIRETSEELNISKDKISIHGEIDYILTPYDTLIKPFVGSLNILDPDKLDYNESEVKEIFTVPLRFFFENPPKLYYVSLEPKVPSNFPFHKIPGGRNYPFKFGKYPVYFYQYQNCIIWGMTARIMKNFITILEEA